MLAGIRRRTPLPHRFKQDHRACCRDVQRVHLSGHRDAQQMIACASNQIVQPGAFASQHKHGIGPEIVAVVIRRAALVQANAPEVALLEHFKGANQIDHAREAKMLGRSRRGLDGDGTERGGTALGEQDAVDAGGFGGSQQRAQVLRVFDAVESQHEAGFGAVEKVFHPEEPALPDHGNHSLVGSGAGDLGQGIAGLGAHRNPGRAGERHDLGQAAGIALGEALAGHGNVIKLPGSGTQRLLDRVEAIDGFHPIKFILAEGANPTDNGEVTGNFGSGGVRFTRESGEPSMAGAQKLEKVVPRRVFRSGSCVRESAMSAAAIPIAEQVGGENARVAEGLKRHDTQLLDELIVQYQHRLLRYLLYLTGNRELAEDLFQETWMRVLMRGAQFNGDSRFDTWLFTIARNLVIDLRRRRSMVSLDEMCEAGDEERPFEVPSQEKTPFDHMATMESGELVAEALLTLDPLHREVLVLRFHEEMSLEEIARMTRAPLSTVKSRLYRGLAALKPHVRPATRSVTTTSERMEAL